MNLQKHNSRDPRVAKVVRNKYVTISETERFFQITVYGTWAAINEGDFRDINQSPKNWEIQLLMLKLLEFRPKKRLHCSGI